MSGGRDATRGATGWNSTSTQVVAKEVMEQIYVGDRRTRVHHGEIATGTLMSMLQRTGHRQEEFLCYEIFLSLCIGTGGRRDHTKAGTTCLSLTSREPLLADCDWKNGHDNGRRLHGRILGGIRGLPRGTADAQPLDKGTGAHSLSSRSSPPSWTCTSPCVNSASQRQT